MEKQVTILNKSGLHARPASEFVKLAARFKSEITILVGTKVANAKSIINVLSLAATMGTVLTLKAVGPDEAEAIDTLSSLIERKFGEE
ncbi:PTS sugar transporter subunit IIA [Brevibacillus choshinensis]|uniref:Phosphocarrier protein HPr n=1 Tax=Brevibacillus choshinensis TaxID=54911 RepID=A0ABR5NDW0_BRECH|nr:HPr family phosphocarrier protein [Brevibacillus choshinensis]KQL49604.1 PTS sugar transporter subunit IIA [Brevibacillus choshinensis]MED4582729.1 HPr family phosphocarrier protein [Brevibacillus choshinensis]MED4779841.1 HPr family phosphocarrier protein [Brevibacillus choshinensis]